MTIPEVHHGSAEDSQPSEPQDRPVTPKEDRPPLPPRPSELVLLGTRSASSKGGHTSPGKPRGLLSRATTAVSITDVNTSSRVDGSREIHASTPKRLPSSPSVGGVGS